MATEELFNVWQFFPDNTHECVGRGLTAEQAVNLAHSYTTRPAAQIGIIQRVMITDCGDCCVFEWTRDQGVIFPPEAAGRGSYAPLPEGITVMTIDEFLDAVEDGNSPLGDD
jgi:hypothetical protein